jgi:hypothetical protein
MVDGPSDTVIKSTIVPTAPKERLRQRSPRTCGGRSVTTQVGTRTDKAGHQWTFRDSSVLVGAPLYERLEGHTAFFP